MDDDKKARDDQPPETEDSGADETLPQKRIFQIKDLLVHLIGFDEYGRDYGRPACEQYPTVWRPLRYQLRRRGFQGHSERRLFEDWLEYLEFEAGLRRNAILRTPMLQWQSLLDLSAPRTDDSGHAIEASLYLNDAQQHVGSNSALQTVGPKFEQPATPDVLPTVSPDTLMCGTSSVAQGYISQDGRTLVWGGVNHPLTGKAASLVRLLLDAYPKFLHEEYLRQEAEFNISIRNLVGYNRLQAVVIRDPSRRGFWGLCDPLTLKNCPPRESSRPVKRSRSKKPKANRRK